MLFPKLASKKSKLVLGVREFCFALPEGLLCQRVDKDRGVFLSSSLQVLPEMTVLSTIRSTDRYQSGDSSVININFQSDLLGPLTKTGDCELEEAAGGRKLTFESTSNRQRTGSAESNRPSSREKPVKIKYLKTSLIERTYGDKDSHSETEFQSKKTVTFLEEPKIIEYEKETSFQDCPDLQRPKPPRPREPPATGPTESALPRGQSAQGRPGPTALPTADKENQDANQQQACSERPHKRVMNLKDLQLNPKTYCGRRTDFAGQRLALREAEQRTGEREAGPAVFEKLLKSKRSEPTHFEPRPQPALSAELRTASHRALAAEPPARRPAGSKESVNSSLQKIFQENYLRGPEETERDRWLSQAAPRPAALARGDDSMHLGSQPRLFAEAPERRLSSELVFKRSLSSNDLARAKAPPPRDPKDCRPRSVNRSGMEQGESASCRSLFSKSTNLPKKTLLEQGRAITDSIITPSSVLAKSIEQARANFRDNPFRSNSIVSSKLGFLHAVEAVAERKNSHRLIPAGLRGRGGSIVSELINLKFKVNETYKKIRGLKPAPHPARHVEPD